MLMTFWILLIIGLLTSYQCVELCKVWYICSYVKIRLWKTMYTGLEGLVGQDQQAELLHFTLIVIWSSLTSLLACSYTLIFICDFCFLALFNFTVSCGANKKSNRWYWFRQWCDHCYGKGMPPLDLILLFVSLSSSSFLSLCISCYCVVYFSCMRGAFLGFIYFVYYLRNFVISSFVLYIIRLQEERREKLLLRRKKQGVNCLNSL